MKHGINVEKPKDFKKSIKNLILFLKPYCFWILIAIFLSGVSSILYIICPDQLKEITNIIVSGLQTGIDLTKIKKLSFTLLLLLFLGAIFSYSSHFIMSTITSLFSKAMRLKISEKINRLPLKYFDNTAYGDILSRVTNDVDTLAQMINQSIGSLITSITMLLGSLAMMFITNGILALIAIFSSLFGFFFMVIVLSKSQKYFQEHQEEIGNLNGHIEETYTGHNIVKVYNGYEKEVNDFDMINEKMFNSAFKSHFFSGLMQPFMGFIGNFSYVLICVIGSYMALNQQITFGIVIAFTLYARLFSGSLSQLAQVATSMQSAGAASERVYEFLEEEELSKEIPKTYLDRKKVVGNIEFRNVNFGYDNEKRIIKNFSCIVKPGSKIAIVGPTGAGKTTLVNLLMKFYTIDDGDIFIDRVNIKDLTRENIHDLFIMVLQDTWIFEGTITENIVYNQKNVPMQKIQEICQKIGLDRMIRTLNNGYDTYLSDSEILSAGEKQLLTIARGMIKDAPFLILDEATSSVDTRTEELVSQAMDALTKGRTSFIIAHRLSTIKNADLILVLDHGNIVEQGTHESLLKKNGFYSKLYHSQFEKIND